MVFDYVVVFIGGIGSGALWSLLSMFNLSIKEEYYTIDNVILSILFSFVIYPLGKYGNPDVSNYYLILISILGAGFSFFISYRIGKKFETEKGKKKNIILYSAYRMSPKEHELYGEYEKMSYEIYIDNGKLYSYKYSCIINDNTFVYEDTSENRIKYVNEAKKAIQKKLLCCRRGEQRSHKTDVKKIRDSCQ